MSASTYLSLEQVRESARRLSAFHVFFGTTFLVLKRNEVPIGSTSRLSLDAENKAHLDKYFRTHPKSAHYFLPFKAARDEGPWRKPKYASTSLQAVNTQAFAPALIHPAKEKLWGWSRAYLDFLQDKLPSGRRLPLFDLAVWLYRDRTWEPRTTKKFVAARFIREFHLGEQELRRLFDVSLKSSVPENRVFKGSPARWNQLLEGFPDPPDVPPESGAILQFLGVTGIGPARHIQLPASSRLNVITGDNGLGKTFLLDIIWWALTREWAGHPATPIGPQPTAPQISFSVSTRTDQQTTSVEFSTRMGRWGEAKRKAVSGLVVYARVDGSFAVWDPAGTGGLPTSGVGARRFSRGEVWHGEHESGIEGLLRDWVRWQTRRSEFPAYEAFHRLVHRVMPPDLGTLKFGKPTRVLGWSMEIPTLVHSYGEVPVVFESAGIQRILMLVYLIVWAWENHKTIAAQLGRPEERQMVLIVDEAEAHLHPRWQRVLLPALLGIANDLAKELSIQFFLASHSPLVLASAEPDWKDEKDSLFHLTMRADGKVTFDQIPFVLYGTADAWLQSEAFGVAHPGSAEAESALVKAKRLLTQKRPSPAEVRAAHLELSESLAAEDPFWLRWVIFAGKHGIDV